MSSVAGRFGTGRCSRLPALVSCLLLVAGCGSGSGSGDSATVSVLGARPIGPPPSQSFGAGVDGHGQGETAQIYTRPNLRAMLSAGLGPLAYRLRTELGSEAWHWNPQGSWSKPGCRCGYWTSSAHAGAPIRVSYGYRLPRRGNTIDQANNDGYSRIDDGNASTFWKSNPYLDGHPQWVMADLGAVRPVDHLQARWKAPYAARFQVQYWSGATPPARYGAERENEVFAHGVQGAWHPFPLAAGVQGHAGLQRVSLARTPVQARYLRLLLERSSHTGPAGDPRNRMGFALAELSAGGAGTADWIRHGASNSTQSVIWVSSTDPWHRAADLDPRTEQPGFDTVYGSGLTRGAAMLVPVALAYGTPADGAAELRWLRARRYPVSALELGEEPDGQLIGPEDYGSLYARFARALPGVTLGGPAFATAIPDWSAWPDGHGTSSWTARFVAQLRQEGALGRLGFFSFEWYPFDDVCAPAGPQLKRQSTLLAQVIARQRAAGLPASVPLAITEYGYSPFAAQAEVELSGALIDADIAASFLALGGRQAYFYGYEPDQVMRESRHCASYGNLALLRANSSHRVLQPFAAFWAMGLLTHHWAGAGLLRSSVHGASGISAYAMSHGAGRTALLLINKSGARRHVRTTGAWGGYLLGPAQYRWIAHGASGHASPDGPPAQLNARLAGNLALPAQSLAVVCLGGRC